MATEERRRKERETPTEMSPLGLFQERLRGLEQYPWKMCVACVLLNRTRGEQVEDVVWELLRAYPTPLDLSRASVKDLEGLLQPLGLYRRRAAVLKQMSTSWYVLQQAGATTETFGRLLELLAGLGPYARDSWTIFVEGRLDVVPTDERLKGYVFWAKHFLAAKEDAERVADLQEDVPEA